MIALDNKTVFISELKSHEENANSTHIMALNLIHGFLEAGADIFLFVILKEDNDENALRRYLEILGINFWFIKSLFSKNTSKYRELANILKGTVTNRKYEKQINNLDIEGIPKKIISNVPSFETVFWGNAFKKRFQTADYYQYWSDPITLSGITPERLSIKRYPFLLAETRALRMADRVIYGTRTLLMFEKRIIKKYHEKMRYIDISYQFTSDISEERYIKSNGDKKHLFYAGNYYLNIRNIKPLIYAVEKIPDINLEIYGEGDFKYDAPNIHFHGRVSPEVLEQKILDCGVNVCLLNHSSIQIPGKIFYSMNKNVDILVIADGVNSEEIIGYLNTYNRFVVCENTVDSIQSAVFELIHRESKNKGKVNERYSPKCIANDLLNGGLQ